ncbi:nucleoside deaminase [Nonomuraea rosea]|uniref:Nucleoside deaminase n=1 Tax=Nonomuraea rosea TaxID=638574 RepID=A0ABP6YUW1_9ACTN
MPDQLLSTADQSMLDLAVQEAGKSLQEKGIPVGAALAHDGALLASGHNERIQSGDPIAHGEMSCLRNAGRRPSYRDTTLYTTLSPCPMCTGAILLFQIPRVVIGECETYAGDIGFLRSRGVEVLLAGDERCVSMMREFQRRHAEAWSEDIGGR